MKAIADPRDGEVLGMIARPLAQMLVHATTPLDDITFVLHTDGRSVNESTIRAALARANANLAAYNFLSLQDAAARSRTTERFIFVLVSSFGLVGLVLAAVGLYGLLALQVARREREFGIRSALGATARQIIQLVARQGAVLLFVRLHCRRARDLRSGAPGQKSVGRNAGAESDRVHLRGDRARHRGDDRVLATRAPRVRVLILLLHFAPNDTMNDLKVMIFASVLRAAKFARIYFGRSSYARARGIGLNTAIFSLINDLFLRGLPFKEPARVVHFFSATSAQRCRHPVSAPRYHHFRDGQTIFDGFAAENGLAFTVTGLGDPVQVSAVKANVELLRCPRCAPNSRPQFPARGRGRRRCRGDHGKLLAETARRRSERGRAQHHARRRGAHDRRRSAEYAGDLVRAEPVGEVWTTKPFHLPGFSSRAHDARHGFSARGRTIEAWRDEEQALAALQLLEQSYRSQYPEKIDAQFDHRQDVAGRCDGEFARRVRHALSRPLALSCSSRAATSPIFCSFDSVDGAAKLRCAWRWARRAPVCCDFSFSKVLLVSVLAGVLGALLAWQLVPLVPKLAANFLPLEPAVRQSFAFRCSRSRSDSRS